MRRNSGRSYDVVLELTAAPAQAAPEAGELLLTGGEKADAPATLGPAVRATGLVHLHEPVCRKDPKRPKPPMFCPL